MVLQQEDDGMGVNHVKIRIKDKKIDEERQVSMLDMKLAKVQKVCNGESRELLEKSKIQMETVQKEVKVTLTRQKIHLNETQNCNVPQTVVQRTHFLETEQKKVAE